MCSHYTHLTFFATHTFTPLWTADAVLETEGVRYSSTSMYNQCDIIDEWSAFDIQFQFYTIMHMVHSIFRDLSKNYLRRSTYRE